MKRDPLDTAVLVLLVAQSLLLMATVVALFLCHAVSW